jgi:hypothetical protein
MYDDIVNLGEWQGVGRLTKMLGAITCDLLAEVDIWPTTSAVAKTS